MHPAQVKIVADSISRDGKRITTFQLRYWRGIHSEFMTHHAIAKNAGSSRARPSLAIIEQVRSDPWSPLHWGKNMPGMQAAEELTGDELAGVQRMWAESAMDAARNATIMMNYGAHKQIVNRILEPYTFIDVVATATEWNNFFALRVHPAADPTIFDLASQMKEAFLKNTPKILSQRQWHTPFIELDDWQAAEDYLNQHGTINGLADIQDLIIKISVARCARTSYKAFDGNVASVADDLRLYKQLIESTPMHASPAEHQAQPDFLIGDNLWANRKLHANFVGWKQYRKTLANECVPG